MDTEAQRLVQHARVLIAIYRSYDSLIIPDLVGLAFFVVSLPFYIGLLLAIWAVDWIIRLCTLCFVTSFASRGYGFLTKWYTAIPVYVGMFIGCRSDTFYRDLQDFKSIHEETKKMQSESSETTFVIPKGALSKLTFWPKHEVARQQGLLVEIKISEMQRYGEDNADTVFISHKWMGNSPDTPDSAILRKIKDEVLMSSDKYVWFDYTCVPQDDAGLRTQHLRSIPSVLRRCRVCDVHGDEQLRIMYQSSVWCQLEAIACQNVESNKRGQLTMYDKNDYFYILPGFLALATSPEFTMQFLTPGTGQERREVFASILQDFLGFADHRMQTHNPAFGV